MWGLARLAVSAFLILSLVYVWLDVDWAAVGAALAATRWPAAVVAVVCVLLAIWTKSVRWRGLLAPRVKISHSRALALVLAGQLANNGLPVRVGEVARVALLNPGGAGRAYVVSTILAEKVFDALGLVVVALLFAWLAPVPPWLRLATPVVTIIGGIILAAGVWAGGRYGPVWLSAHARSALAGLSAVAQPRRLAWAALWTVAGLAAGAAANWWSLAAVGIQPSPEASLLVLLALYFGGVLPAPPGRLGVFQALCVAAVVPFGVAAALALAYGVVHYLVVVVVPSILGALYLVGAMGWRRACPAGLATPVVQLSARGEREWPGVK